jgi:hypothetical protein
VSIFDKLTARQLLVFSEIMAESTLMHIEFVREKYSRSALNFDETMEFLKELGLVDIQDGQISPKSGYKTLLTRLSNPRQKEQVFKSYIGRLMVERKTPFFGEVGQFMRYFKFENNQYEFKPKRAAQRLGFSGLRNFLMDIEVVRLDPNTMTYIMNEDYYECLIESVEERGLTPEEFIQIERRNREIGLKAELRIIEYEKDRLAAFPGLIGKIEHVAKNNVSLGYDIKSYEVTGEELGGVRLIEVKAVSIWNYGFNWTRSEIEASQTNRNSYYLYLLPVIAKSEFDLENLKIINDPYTNVLNSEQWLKCCEVLSLKAMQT